MTILNVHTRHPYEGPTINFDKSGLILGGIVPVLKYLERTNNIFITVEGVGRDNKVQRIFADNIFGPKR